MTAVRAIVAEHVEVPEDDAAPLELDSLTLVLIVEALEERLGLRVAASEVIPENFASVASIAAFVERKR